MKNYLYLIIIFLFITNCTLNKVIKHNGVHFLEKKQTKLTVQTSNKNDIIQLLGPPSTKSTFDNDLWIYIERSIGSSKLSRLGKRTLLTNNVLILEIDSRGLLAEKIFLNKDDMNKVDFSKDYTKMTLTKKSFIYDFLSSVRKKMNNSQAKK
jgi:outer membrane protein assembly factor BamE (lipoprotein component of BamABCDE complex)|tara:strand:+ start:73 stop:528 length:456 start_codon:yes stop_codon:yes gene_type:complete